MENINFPMKIIIDFLQPAIQMAGGGLDSFLLIILQQLKTTPINQHQQQPPLNSLTHWTPLTRPRLRYRLC